MVTLAQGGALDRRFSGGDSRFFRGDARGFSQLDCSQNTHASRRECARRRARVQRFSTQPVRTSCAKLTHLHATLHSRRTHLSTYPVAEFVRSARHRARARTWCRWLGRTRQQCNIQRSEDHAPSNVQGSGFIPHLLRGTARAIRWQRFRHWKAVPHVRFVSVLEHKRTHVCLPQ